ncbi:MAG: hypothetical protein R2729_21995 [Bryobacteraceae bacterium]
MRNRTVRVKGLNLLRFGLWACTLGAFGADLPAIFHEERIPGRDPEYVGLGFSGPVRVTANGMRFGRGGAVELRFAGDRQPAQIRGDGTAVPWARYVGNRVERGNGYSRIRLHEAYPGIDVLVYRQGRNVEYDLEVAKGADPAGFRIVIEGATARVDDQGDLLISGGEVELRHRAPRVTQNGKAVAARYEMHGQEVGIALDEYDRTRDLVVDPLVEWIYLLNSYAEQPMVSGLTPDGKLVVATVAATADFFLPTVVGQAFPAGSSNLIAVWQLTEGGNEIARYTIFGANWNNTPYDMAIAADGSIHIVGQTVGTGFPIVGGFISSHPFGDSSGFYVRLDPQFGIAYSTLITGSGLNNSAEKIALNPKGDVYIAGYTDSTDFPLINGRQTQASRAFLMQIRAGLPIYSSYWGIRQGTASTGVGPAVLALSATDNELAVAMLGCTGTVTSPSRCDYPIVKLSADLKDVLWSRSMSTTIIPASLLWGADSNLFVGGGQAGRGPSISKLNGATGVTLWDYRPALKDAGGRILSLAQDTSGYIYGGGEAGLPGPLVNAFQTANMGFLDGYFVRLNPAGSAVDATLLGGDQDDRILRVHLTSTPGVLYLTGTTQSFDFPQTEVVLNYFPLYRTSAPWAGKLDLTKDECRTWVNPVESVMAKPGGAYPLRVFTTGAACSWSFTSDQPWARTNLPSGSNSGRMTITVDTNFGAARTANLSSGGLVKHTVRQTNSDCRVTLSTGRLMVPNKGGVYNVDYSVGNSCAAATWTSDSSWASGKYTGFGINPSFDRVQVTVAANTTGRRREARLSFAGYSFRVVQGQTGDGGNSPSVPSANVVQAGVSQVLTFQFYHPKGFTELDVVNVLINQYLDGDHACYVAYSRKFDVLYLVKDLGPGSGLSDGLTLGNTGSVSNSQCRIYSAGSSAAGDGNTLTLKLNVEYLGTFKGNKVIYSAARDLGGLNSGWQTVGASLIPEAATSYPAPFTMSPVTGAAATQTVSFAYRDAASAGNIKTVWALMNTAIDGRQACFVAYYAPGNTLYLYPDNGDGGQAASIVLAGTNTIENSQCRISAQGSTVLLNGNQLTLNLNMQFKPAFHGSKAVWMAVQTLANQTSAWKVNGSWQVPQ